MTNLSQAAQDALFTYRIASKDQRCPICRRKNCGHGFREQLQAELAGDQAPSPRNDMAGLQRLAENVKRGGPNRVGLTPLQRQLLDNIKSFITDEGFSPSYEEMMSLMDVKSKATIHRLVTGLEERGAIRRLSGQARSVVIVGEMA